jgi:hypothetical protein
MLDIETAIGHAEVELRTKSMREIQRETAYTWAARAIAAHRLLKRTDVSQRKARTHLAIEVHEYMHEALEHSALGGTYAAVNALFDEYQLPRG